MSRLGLLLYFLFFASGLGLQAQVSSDCSNAIVICNDTPVNGGTTDYGIDDFNGATESGCLRQTTSGVIETNSAWYKFRTGASGQLGFNIGFDAAEDWDFALYKTSDCSNLGTPVRCNFFDNTDENTNMGVGVDPTGDTETFLYEDWLQVTPGEDYLLLINNFSNNNSGFSIQFSGNIFVTNPNDALDCSIINNLLGPPVSACDTDTVVLDATTATAIGYEWYLDIGTGFSRIPGEIAPTLNVAVSGLYRVLVIMPLGNNIISEVQVAFSPSPVTYPLQDEVSCSDNSQINLSLKDNEALGAQSPNDFRVSYYSTQNDAINATNPLAKENLTLTSSQIIYVRTSSIENPKCFDVSESFTYTIVEAPNLTFDDELFLCANETSGTIGELSPNPNYVYRWNTGEDTSSLVVTQAGVYTLTASNSSNGIDCETTKTVTVIKSELPEITDIKIEDLQSSNTVEVFINLEGNYIYQINDEEEQQSRLFKNVLPGRHTVRVIDPEGCGEVSEEIIVIGFEKFFTPNGDAVNEYWNIKEIEELQNPQVYIYDRFGKFLYQFGAEAKGWDGTYNGIPLPATDYWFKLTYVDENGQTQTAKYINNHFSLKR